MKNRKKLLDKLKKEIAKINKTRPEILADVHKSKWPYPRENLTRVMLSRYFMVQIFQEESSIRLSVNRTTINDDLTWKENITWDELQEVKRQCGYGNRLAVEIYPADDDIVNVANMRHLWILNHDIKAGWRREIKEI